MNRNARRRAKSGKGSGMPFDAEATANELITLIKAVPPRGAEGHAAKIAEVRKQVARVRRDAGRIPGVEKMLRKVARAADLMESGETPRPDDFTGDAAILAAPWLAMRDAIGAAGTVPVGPERAQPVTRARNAVDDFAGIVAPHVPADELSILGQLKDMVSVLEHKDGYYGRAITEIQQRIRDYFRGRRMRLLAASTEAVIEHTTATGSHREELVQELLREHIPHRFSVDGGMVYSEQRRTHQADVVIWDSLNFPRIPQGGGRFLFFARSVHVVVEVKSRWNIDEREDILTKCQSARAVTTAYAVARDEWGQIATGPDRFIAGATLKLSRLDFVAVAFAGGQTLTPATIAKELVLGPGATLPRITWLAEAGKVLWVQHDPTADGSGGYAAGRLKFFDAGQDSLLLFLSLLLGLLTERSAHYENPFYLQEFCAEIIAGLPSTDLDFTPSSDAGEPGCFTVIHRPA